MCVWLFEILGMICWGGSYSKYGISWIHINRVRSTGYGSLQIWMRHLRKGITHQETFKPSSPCARCDWNGAAVTVAGGYVWDDVYEEAFARGLIVVGGGDPVRSSFSSSRIELLTLYRQSASSVVISKEAAIPQQPVTLAWPVTRSWKRRSS